MNRSVIVHIDLVIQLSQIEVEILHVAQLVGAELRGAEVGDPLYPINGPAIVLVHYLHLALYDRSRWLLLAMQPNEHLHLTDVEYVVAIYVVGRKR